MTILLVVAIVMGMLYQWRKAKRQRRVSAYKTKVKRDLWQIQYGTRYFTYLQCVFN